MACYILLDEEIDEMSQVYIYVQNVHDLLRTPDFKSFVSHLGLGLFMSRSRLDLLLQVSVSSRSRGAKVSSRSRRFWPRPQL